MTRRAATSFHFVPSHITHHTSLEHRTYNASAQWLPPPRGLQERHGAQDHPQHSAQPEVDLAAVAAGQIHQEGPGLGHPAPHGLLAPQDAACVWPAPVDQQLLLVGRAEQLGQGQVRLVSGDRRHHGRRRRHRRACRAAPRREGHQGGGSGHPTPDLPSR